MTELLVAKHDGSVVQRVRLNGRRKLTIGRSPRCDLTLTASSISRHHAVLFQHESQWHLCDSGSRFGMEVSGERTRCGIFTPRRWAKVGPAYLWLVPAGKPPTGGGGIQFPGNNGRLGPPPAPTTLVVVDAAAPTLTRVDLTGQELVTVGRHDSCQLRLGDPEVSRLHCVLYTEPRGWYVSDAASTTGTRIEGRPSGRRRMKPDRLVRIGCSTIWMEGAEVSRRPDEEDATPAAETLMGSEIRPVPPALGDPLSPESCFLDDPGDLLGS